MYRAKNTELQSFQLFKIISISYSIKHLQVCTDVYFEPKKNYLKRQQTPTKSSMTYAI